MPDDIQPPVQPVPTPTPAPTPVPLTPLGATPPAAPFVPPTPAAPPPAAPLPPAGPKQPTWKKWWFWASVGGGIVVLGAVLFVVFLQLRPDPYAGTTLALAAPEATTAGSTITYTAAYQNGSELAMRDASLSFTYPSGFTAEESTPDATDGTRTQFSLGDVAPGATGEVLVTGTLTGQVDSIHVVTARLTFQSADSSASFVREGEARTAINPSSLTLTADIPETHFSGEEITYTLEVANNESQALTNVRIEVDYPIGFTLAEATPPGTEDDTIWTFATLGVGARERIEITGTLVGEPNDAKRITFRAGRVIDSGFFVDTVHAAVTRITLPAVTVAQAVTVNGKEGVTAIHEGDRLEYTLQFRNTGVTSLSGLVLEAELTPRVLDLSTLRISDDGALTDGTTIRWDSSVVPALGALAPGATGQVSFRVDVYKDLFVTNASDQNFTVTSTPQVSVSGRTVQGDAVSLKVGATADLAVSGTVVSGPGEPTVGQTTTYEITWALTVRFAGMENLRLTAAVPPGVTWEDAVTVSSGSPPAFNTGARTLLWNVGTVLANLGELSPPLTARFRVSVTPTVADQGDVLTLLRTITITGQDSFAGVPVSRELADFTTELGGAADGEVQS